MGVAASGQLAVQASPSWLTSTSPSLGTQTEVTVSIRLKKRMKDKLSINQPHLNSAMSVMRGGERLKERMQEMKD